MIRVSVTGADGIARCTVVAPKDFVEELKAKFGCEKFSFSRDGDTIFVMPSKNRGSRFCLSERMGGWMAQGVLENNEGHPEFFKLTQFEVVGAALFDGWLELIPKGELREHKTYTKKKAAKAIPDTDISKPTLSELKLGVLTLCDDLQAAQAALYEMGTKVAINFDTIQKFAPTVTFKQEPVKGAENG